jgi:3-dehydroquinate synthetase
MIEAAAADRIEGLIQHLGLPTRIHGVDLPAIQRAMAHDKKWIHGKNRWVLPVEIGRVVVRDNIPDAVMTAGLRRYAP